MIQNIINQHSVKIAKFQKRLQTNFNLQCQTTVGKFLQYVYRTILSKKKPSQISKNGLKKSQSISQLQQKLNHLSMNDIPIFAQNDTLEQMPAQSDGKIEQIRKQIIGFNSRFLSPFQIELQTLYVDHTATNRPYQAIQIMIQYAKKYAANPHTQFSHYGKYSTDMIHYARDSLLQSFSADPQIYIALPAGSGCTGTIQKTINMLKTIENADKIQPTVFITSYEHHSNILPWVEYYDQRVQLLAHNEDHDLLMEEILKQLLQCEAKKIIVSVSAASNVTSKITPLKQLNQIIKRARQTKNIIFCVDCAAFCCHHQLNLSIYDQVDFAFLSPHKNLGGSQSCGVLVVRKSIIQFAKPTFPGGGTVRFVKGYRKGDVLYSVDIFEKQIAGTPPFLGFYRAALSFQLLKDIGYDYIHQRQTTNTNQFIKMIRQINQRLSKEGHDTYIQIYGDQDFSKRANVITFNFISGKALVHHSFISLIFTDIFGIQVRSGCFCAGPFGKNLLKIDKKVFDQIEEQVKVGILIDKPGYLRLDITFYLQAYEVIYIAKAMEGIARYWRHMEKFYTVCNDGQIKRYEFNVQIHRHHFSLKQFRKAHTKILDHLKDDAQNLANRRCTLQKQLCNGLYILKHPIQFLKKMKNLIAGRKEKQENNENINIDY